MPKAANKYAVDLFDANADTLDILFGTKSSVVVCDTLNTTHENDYLKERLKGYKGEVYKVLKRKTGNVFKRWIWYYQ